MRIMLTDSSDTCQHVADTLRSEGHDVLDACLPNPERQHECRGLSTHDCPLLGDVDVAITTLEREQDVASAGTVCARRSGIPVVTVGRHDADHEDLAASLHRMSLRGDELVAMRARLALRDALDAMGVDDDDSTVEVVHHPDRDQIVARVTSPLTEPQRASIGVRLLDAATSTGRRSSRRDVVVVCA